MHLKRAQGNSGASRRSRKSVLILACSALLAIIATLLLALGFGSRPTLYWQGKPSAYWIGRLNFYDNQGGPSAEEFLLHAGPGIVPELIAGLKLRDSAIYDKWVDVYFKLGPWQKHFELPTKRSSYRANCARGLGLLGPAAGEATAPLLAALHDSNEQVRSAAAEALGRIATANDTNVVHALISGLQSTNSNYHLTYVIALTRLLPGSAAAADALRKQLSVSDDVNIRSWAAVGLALDDTQPERTFEALRKALQDTHANVRSRSAASLGKLNWAPELRTKELLRALKKEQELPERDDILTWRIVRSLGEIGPAASEAVEDLQRLTKEKNPLKALAFVALSRIDPEERAWERGLIETLQEKGGTFWCAFELGRRGARDALPILHDTAADPTQREETRLIAAIAKWQIDPSFPPPFTSLSEFLLTLGTAGKFEFVTALGELGPRAHSMIPTLRQLLYCRGPMMHDYAASALRKIDPEYIRNPWKPYSRPGAGMLPRTAGLKEVAH